MIGRSLKLCPLSFSLLIQLVAGKGLECRPAARVPNTPLPWLMMRLKGSLLAGWSHSRYIREPWALSQLCSPCQESRNWERVGLDMPVRC